MKRFLLAVWLCLCGLDAHASDPTVLAAASLADALNSVAHAYHEASGHDVRLSFAASSVLARQIEAGAPAAMFISADEDWMNELASRQLLVPDTRRDLLGNTLVLITAADNPVEVELRPGFDLAALIGTGRLAMGEPDSVPAGKYGRHALESLGLWDGVKDHIAAADSVRSALAFVARKEASFGIVYGTDAAITPSVRVAATFPASSHAPIVYPLALVKGQDSEDARAFLKFVEGPKAREIFQHYGFTVAP